MEKQIDYLRKLTDDFGMVQFSKRNNPDIKSGYTIDDVSRALIVSSKLGLEDLSEVYFDFIKNAQISDGRFVNVYSGERKPLEHFGSEDSFGRTLWALGEYLNEKGEGEEISFKALESLSNFGVHYPMSESFAILGLTKMHDADFEKEKTSNLIKKLADSISNRFTNNSGRDWFWISDEMSYENSRVPQALLRAYNSIGFSRHLDDGKTLTNFLDKTVFEKDSEGQTFLNVVGNNTSGLGGTWYKRGFEKPKYDEQPVDVGGMVELHSEIYDFSRDKKNLDKAKISFDWFNGRNRLEKNMISDEGGIYDGLNENYVNPNHGAESLLAYMMAKIKFDEIKNGI
jgi:hypothetical protein